MTGLTSADKIRVATVASLVSLALAGCAAPDTETDPHLAFLAHPDNVATDPIRVLQAAAASGRDPTTWPSHEPVMAALHDVSADLRLGDAARLVHGLALAGLDPRTAAGPDLIERLLGSYDGGQFGDASSLADDMWVIIALGAAGHVDDPRVAVAADGIIEAQHPSGGWSWHGEGASIDETAWAVAALAAVGRLAEARDVAPFLTAQQAEDGSFAPSGGIPNAQSTALAVWAASLAGGIDADKAIEYVGQCAKQGGGYAHTPSSDATAWVTADVVVALSLASR